MNHMKSMPATMKYLILTLLVVVMTIATTVLSSHNSVHAASAAGFTAGRIIDDAVFTNSNSMNASQIQAFLNSKVPTCDTNGTGQYPGYQDYAGETAAQWGTAHNLPPPYICLKDYTENGLTSAQIIYNVAQKYGINPQVLIVLLQKEQGLVTDTWPTPGEYKTATGYGCPDTASCDTTYYGFTNQVTWAATMYRSILNQSSTWYSPYVLGNNFIQWNPNSSCGGSTVNIQNLSTVALYDYTPYQPNQAALNAGYGAGDACSAYGNRNFYLYFTDWFGSTTYSEPPGASVLYQSSTGKIFLVTDTTRFYIPNWNIMTDYGLDTYPAVPVSDTTINQYSDGGILTNLVYDSSNGVYLVNNRVRYHVSAAMCTAWGFSCYDSSVVKPLGSNFQTQYLQQGWELTSLAASNGVIYNMSNGKRQPIANPKTLGDLGLATTSILVTSSVNSSQPLGPLLMTTPGVISFPPSQAIYYYDGTNYYSVPGVTSYADWALQNQPQLVAPVSSYNSIPPTSTTLSPWYKDSSGNEYIIDSGRRVQVPASLQNLWQSQTFSNQPQSLVDNLPQTVLQNFVWASPDIYSLSNGSKHYIPTWSDYLALGVNSQNTTGLQPDKLSVVTQGNDALGSGIVISIQGDAQKLYVINNGHTTWIPDPNTYNSYGFSWGGILTYPTSILDDYPLASTPLVSGVANGNYYIIGNGSMYTLSSSNASDFGVIGSHFQSIDMQLVKNSKTSTLSRFLYDTDNGKIFYASGGAIHYVATYSAFVAYGGTKTPASAVTDTDINLFLQAQAVY